MVNLKDQWRIQLELVIENLIRGGREHREIASLSEQIGADYHGRFLVELLQNANDQAVTAGDEGSSVAIARTDGVLAVLNQGEPFDDDGLRAMTSMGLSSKSPERCLGNKGIGFKAVFEVCRAPEIYSAPRPGTSFIEPDATRFCLDRAPFSDSARVARARKLISQILEARKTELTVGEVLDEARRAAPFKFPLSLREDRVDSRLSSLGISEEHASRFQTMVVLPLKDDAGQIVDDALEALVDKRGATVLFLDGVTEVEIYDRHHNAWCELGIRSRGAGEKLESGICLKEVQTWKERADLPLNPHDHSKSSSIEKMSWWKVERKVGSPDGVPRKQHQKERRELRHAVESLPGETWRDLDPVPVAVALPRSGVSDDPGAPLGAGGLFCIGLPTEQPTGTPVWIHSHFHGNISRTEIELEAQRYNELLFEEALSLVGTLLDRLRESLDIEDRRLVTLVMETATGPVAEVLCEEWEIDDEEVVLAADGVSYLTPRDIVVPGDRDMEMLQLLSAEEEAPADDERPLPEGKLLANGRKVLRALTGDEDPRARVKSLFLDRGETGSSLLERGAKRHRKDGPGFWSPFLEWVHDRFTVEEVGGQRILPVGSSQLRTAEDRVFFRPVDGTEDLGMEASSSEVASVPELPLFDEDALRVRTEDGEYTELARKLAPEQGPALVRRFRALDLINDALVPYMERAVSGTPDEGAALTALLVTLKLTDRITAAETRARIRRDRFRVPVGDESGSVSSWISPEQAYLGPGWVDDKTDALLEVAYGGHGCRLIPWPAFEPLVESEDAKTTWTDRMKVLGVAEAPVLRRPEEARKAPLQSESRKRLSKVPGISSPLPGLEDLWDEYLEDIKHIRVSTKSNQAFDVDEVIWVDGLERPESRAAVVELMLRHPGKYLDAAETILGRKDRPKDRRAVPTLWVHALRDSDWEIIPTTHGLVCPKDAWLISLRPNSRLPDRYRFLPVISESLRSREADALLEAMGVNALDGAATAELVHALHQLAEQLDDLSAQEERSAKALAKDLYADLQTALGDEESVEGMAHIDDRPVPLLRHGLESVDLHDVEAVYLDDDPIRGRFVRELERAPRIPTRRVRRSYSKLVEALRGVLGEDRVRLTSAEPVETGFKPIPAESRLLTDKLKADFVERNVELDLAAVLVFTGSNPLDPEGDRFRKLWSEFRYTRVQPGRFPSVPEDVVAFLDRAGEQEPVLQLSVDASPDEALEATWQLFGEGHRDAIALYAQRLSQAEGVERFFSRRGVEQEDFQQLQQAVEGTAASELEQATALTWVLARGSRPELSIDDFKAAWTPTEITDSDAYHLVGVPIEPLRRFGRAVLRRDEQAVADLLSANKVTPRQWQRARRQLGKQPWRFETAAQQFAHTRERLVAEIKALTARRPSVDVDRCRDLVRQLMEIQAPPELLLSPPSQRKSRQSAVSLALSAIADTKGMQLPLIERRLTEEVEAETAFLPGDVPEKEVSDYLHSTLERRRQRAQEFLKSILSVAVDLAETRDERLDRDSVVADTRVTELSEGWLASHHALAPLLREELRERIPKTAEALTDAGAFRRRDPTVELWQKFPEIDSPDRSDPDPKQSFTIFGESWEEDEIGEDLASASQGDIGARAQELADRDVDFLGLATREREAVPANGDEADAYRTRGGGGGGSSRDRSVSHKAKDINGLIGEVFAFEQLRRVLQDFDIMCWVSENRARYGHGEPGSDLEGCDFRYVDVEGALTPNEGAVCEIEVKATSESRPEKFTLTRNEMDRARECHGADDREYVILWVANVREVPELHDVLVDPVEMWRKGLVDITVRGDRTVRVPNPIGGLSGE